MKLGEGSTSWRCLWLGWGAIVVVLSVLVSMDVIARQAETSPRSDHQPHTTSFRQGTTHLTYYLETATD